MTTDVTALPGLSTRHLNAEIRSLMGRYDVTQMALADWLGLAQPGVSARLRGTVAWKVDELFRLAEGFGVHPAVLFGGRAPDPTDGPPIGADDETRTRNILLGSPKDPATVTPLFGGPSDLERAA